MISAANASIPSTVVRRVSDFKIVGANGQSLAYVYGHADPRDAGSAKLTLDEARRVASAKLLALLAKS